jgi:hypothetical protein
VWEKGKEERSTGDYLLTSRSPRRNPCYGPADAKWPEVCRTLAHKGRDAGVPARFNGTMDVACPECGHGLRAEVMPVADRFRVWACFDDEERSATYAELVGRQHVARARRRSKLSRRLTIHKRGYLNRWTTL